MIWLSFLFFIVSVSCAPRDSKNVENKKRGVPGAQNEFYYAIFIDGCMIGYRELNLPNLDIETEIAGPHYCLIGDEDPLFCSEMDAPLAQQPRSCDNPQLIEKYNKYFKQLELCSVIKGSKLGLGCQPLKKPFEFEPNLRDGKYLCVITDTSVLACESLEKFEKDLPYTLRNGFVRRLQSVGSDTFRKAPRNKQVAAGHRIKHYRLCFFRGPSQLFGCRRNSMGINASILPKDRFTGVYLSSRGQTTLMYDDADVTKAGLQAAIMEAIKWFKKNIKAVYLKMLGFQVNS